MQQAGICLLRMLQAHESIRDPLCNDLLLVDGLISFVIFLAPSELSKTDSVCIEGSFTCYAKVSFFRRC